MEDALTALSVGPRKPVGWASEGKSTKSSNVRRRLVSPSSSSSTSTIYHPPSTSPSSSSTSTILRWGVNSSAVPLNPRRHALHAQRRSYAIKSVQPTGPQTLIHPCRWLRRAPFQHRRRAPAPPATPTRHRRHVCRRRPCAAHRFADCDCDPQGIRQH